MEIPPSSSERTLFYVQGLRVVESRVAATEEVVTLSCVIVADNEPLVEDLKVSELMKQSGTSQILVDRRWMLEDGTTLKSLVVKREVKPTATNRFEISVTFSLTPPRN